MADAHGNILRSYGKRLSCSLGRGRELKGRDLVAAIQDRHILAEYRVEVTREHRLTLANAGQAIASQFSQASCLDAFVEILPFSVLPESCCL